MSAANPIMPAKIASPNASSDGDAAQGGADDHGETIPAAAHLISSARERPKFHSLREHHPLHGSFD